MAMFRRRKATHKETGQPKEPEEGLLDVFLKSEIRWVNSIYYLFIYRYNDIEVIFSLTQSDNRYTKNRYNDIEVIFSQSDNRYTKN